MGTEAEAGSLRRRVRAVMEAHWVPEGYAAPHTGVYPWQWLWDSCFHALVWAELGEPERAMTELAVALSTQDEVGFVPHVNYIRDPGFHAEFWGRAGTSCITQPPMYGHVLAELARRGVAVPEDLWRRARRGLGFLLEHRRRHPCGLVLIAHPWETGCDDSPRFDDLCPGAGFNPRRWFDRKGELVASIVAGPGGAPLANRAMTVAPAGFNALVAFNARELGLDDGGLAEALDDAWDPRRATWVDRGDTESGSGRVRTLDGLLGALVSDDRDRVAAALGALTDPTAHGAPFGPTGVHRAEPTFSPSSYWRGPAWPQLAYLVWVAARRAGHGAIADAVAASTLAGACRSGLAEYWDPDTGQGLGAVPQSWTGLVLLMADPEVPHASGGRSAPGG